MVDALLLKYAYLAGISASGPRAPKAVSDAEPEFIRFKGAQSGVLAEFDDEKYLQQSAEENLAIGMTGITLRGESLNG